MDMDLFTPSYLNSMHDYILNYNMLSLCGRCYLREQDDSKSDYMISPLYTPDALLARFPETHLFVCDMDPLHDDCLRFSVRFLLGKKKGQ